MNIKQLQAALNSLGLEPKLNIDGVAGRNTMKAVDDLIIKHKGPRGWLNWVDSRRQVAAEQILFTDVYKIDTGTVDGLVGEQTRYAREVWQARANNNGVPVPAVENWRDTETPTAPKQTSWPRQRDVASFYGSPGTGQTSMALPYPMRLAWEPTTVVRKMQCHTKCVSAFKAIMEKTLKHYGIEEIRRLRLDMWGGTLNVRKMRGGSSWSMHAYGCAIDIDPDRNQLRWGRDRASLDGPAYEPFWQIVYSEGGLSLGRERNYDWMHYQFTKDFS